MDVRKKLVELLSQVQSFGVKQGSHITHQEGKTNREIASHLIENGVTVQDSTEISDELLQQLRNAPIMVMTEESTIEVVQEWISVKDRLPEDDQIVTICTDKGFVYAGELIGDTWFLDNDSWTANVTHWMPLPEPPKGE